jgi:bifunctional non-homologous end joining protein LigD
MSTSDLLAPYNKKRNFGVTAEPKGTLAKKKKSDLRFVVQLHEARRTHYDFRLEWNGVMKSWAVTRGPSFDPEDKRLAVRTEDHPMDYNSFEGVIPDKQYGAGPVMIWDEGVWTPDYDPEKMEKKGHISFTIEGSRMKGHWHLVRLRTQEKRENWLLIKGKDDYVLTAKKSAAFMEKERTSVVTGRSMPEILAAGNGNTAKGLKKSTPITKKASATKVREKKSENKKPAMSMAALLKKYPSPELATLVDHQPEGKDWVHEIKYDGYRLMAFINKGEVILRTRGDKDWTHKFAPIAKALPKLKIEQAVFDLEACVVDENGRTNFSLLQEALSDENPEKIEAWIFDILYLNGEDFKKNTLLERKKALEKILKNAKPPLHYSDHFESAPNLLTKACKLGAEGLISKRRDSVYQFRRTQDWVKSKCGLEQEFVIGGFMPAKDEPKAVGALLLGYYKNKKLAYAGKVGTGFSRKLAKDVYKQLVPLKTDKMPFAEKPERGRRGYVFVKPEKLCQISFLEWTKDGHIRHGSFKGMREDKVPEAVTEEKPKKVEQIAKKGAKTSFRQKQKEADVSFYGVTITHPDREVYPGTGITKADIAAYYASVAPYMLPYMKKRLISLLRCTGGIGGECFFQRNPMKGMGDRIKPKKVEHNNKEYEYLYIEDEKGLMQLVQMGTFEFHAWQSTLPKLDKPDQIIFDLDPDESVPFEAVKLGAEDIRARLKKIGLQSFPRVTGGKGVHVVVPIKPQYEWDRVKDFARSLAESMQSDAPDAYVANMSKKKRVGKIFIDFFRNDFSATAIAPFSVRAREGAPVAWPLTWQELKNFKSASAFRLADIDDKHIKKAAKIEKNFFSIMQSLPKA